MIISVTERGSFKRCRQQWEYGSLQRQSITAIAGPVALSIGTLIHRSHEEWLLNHDEGAEQATLKAVALELNALKERYKKVVGVEPDDRELSRFMDSASLVLAMMKNYEEKWGASLPEGFTLVQPEQTFIIPIPNTEHVCWTCSDHGLGMIVKVNHECVECNGNPYKVPHYLEGTLDALMRDEGGRLWVLERKTFGQHPKIDSLNRNDQFLAYLWILQQLGMGDVGGLYYDGMWKRDGSKHSLDELFLRTPLQRAPEELANFSVQVRDEVTDMANPDLRIYRNIPWQGCWDCQFEPLCTAEFRGEDAAHIRANRYMTREREDGLGEATD